MDGLKGDKMCRWMDGWIFEKVIIDGYMDKNQVGRMDKRERVRIGGWMDKRELGRMDG